MWFRAPLIILCRKQHFELEDIPSVVAALRVFQFGSISDAGCSPVFVFLRCCERGEFCSRPGRLGACFNSSKCSEWGIFVTLSVQDFSAATSQIGVCSSRREVVGREASAWTYWSQVNTRQPCKVLKVCHSVLILLSVQIWRTEWEGWMWSCRFCKITRGCAVVAKKGTATSMQRYTAFCAFYFLVSLGQISLLSVSHLSCL